MFSEIFHVVLYQPIFNLFVALYNVLPDVGVVILVITLVIKLILYPITAKSIKAQKSLTELQPKLEELKATFKDNQQQLAQETMKLYKVHKVNPFGSCLPLLIQLPVFLALYYVFRDGLTSDNFSSLYGFVANPGHLNEVSFGFLNLAAPSIVLALLAGVAQFWQAKMFMRKQPPKAAGKGGADESMAAIMNKQMLYFMPVMTFIIGIRFPGGLALYWFFSTLLTVLQQQFLFKKYDSQTQVIEGEIVK